MYKTSHYNLYYKLNNVENEYLLVHGFSGAFDVASEDIYKILVESVEEPENLKHLSDENLAILIKRGYITQKSMEEEKNTMKEVALALHRIQSKTVEITIVPTYGCNFRCEYCYEKNLLDKGSDWLGKKMDKQTVDITMNHIRLLRENGKTVNTVTLFGGEPLLKNNFEIVKYTVDESIKLGLKINCISNSYDLDAFQELLGPDKISMIQVTIDGPEEIHDKRRYLAGFQPTFKKIVDNIDISLDKGTKIMVRSNVNNSNINEVEKLVDFFKEKGWYNNPNFTNYFKSTHKCYEAAENAISDVDVMNKITSFQKDTQRFFFDSIYSVISDRIASVFMNKGIAPLRSSYCGATSSMIVVDPFGDIYPCWDVMGSKDELVGRIDYTNGRLELNNHYEYWNGRAVESIDECLECPYALYCGGGCAAHAKVVQDSVYSPYCESFKNVFDDVAPNVYKKYAEEMSKQA